MSLQETAEQAVKRALALGATDAECTIAEGSEFSVSVRKGEIEQLKEAGSRGIGIRVLVGRRAGSAHSSDLTAAGLERMVKAAVDNASVTGEDPFNVLPEECGSIAGDLGLFDAALEKWEAPDKIDFARRAEAAALGRDARIVNSEGGGCESSVSMRYFANSRGFSGAYRSSSCGVSAVPVAQDGDKMERDFWWTSGRGPAGLDSPESVGIKAADRVLRRLGARKVPTQKAPVVFDARMARTLLDHVFDAVSGDSIYQDASFLTGKLGEKVAADHVTIVDDGTMPGLWGTSPFDAEGVPSRRTPVIERGVLKNYLLNTYTAKKLGLKTTGNASRGLSGATYVGNGNFFLEPGALAEDEMLKRVGTGLYVTELLGQGVNVVNGDYSRGAAGLWIENGELAYPVAEITIAGNLRDMLMSIEAIGSELEFRSSMASPPVWIGEMTISGQ